MTITLDLDVTRQQNRRAATLSYLYYNMDLSVRGSCLKIGYQRVIEALPMPRLIGFSADVDKKTQPQGPTWRYCKKYGHTTFDPSIFRQMLNSLEWTTGDSDIEAPLTAIVVGEPKHAPGALFTFISSRIGLPMQGMLDTHTVSPYQMTPPGCSHVSVEDHNEVSQLFEPVRLKLVAMRLSD
ncbi:hypothetical protein JCGZ_20009 [Jatropha curcas]|uniref:Uncharacterized protein n=1 Tax=Jatropha curcas TaxID=180498 RepID=A0A067JUL8_JATCU|nr:hypothetical protein JCGZ_20009 [Jatropha curcas]